MTEQVIDAFENPFLGREDKIMKSLQEEQNGSDPVQVNQHDKDFEQQIFETFVKEKTTLLGYVLDLLKFAAKSQDVDLYASKIIEEPMVTEESKTAELRISNNHECGILAARINAVLEKYQEQSSVLDPILDAFVTPIMKFLQVYVRKAVAAQAYSVPYEVNALFHVLCHLCKVRGYKTVVKFFPHEVSDMEMVVELLHFQETPELEVERTTAPLETKKWNPQYWQVPYILVLWLSIIVLVPFDLTSIDSQRS